MKRKTMCFSDTGLSLQMMSNSQLRSMLSKSMKVESEVQGVKGYDLQGLKKNKLDIQWRKPTP